MDSQQIVNIRKHLSFLLFFFLIQRHFLRENLFKWVIWFYTLCILDNISFIFVQTISQISFLKRKSIQFFFFFLTLLDLHHCMGFSLVATSGSYSLVVVCGLLIVVVCPVGGSEVKASAWNVGDQDLIPGSGRFPGEGNGNPLQYSCLENPMKGGAW